jgi:hypothetical protein
MFTGEGRLQLKQMRAENCQSKFNFPLLCYTLRNTTILAAHHDDFGEVSAICWRRTSSSNARNVCDLRAAREAR